MHNFITAQAVALGLRTASAFEGGRSDVTLVSEQMGWIVYHFAPKQIWDLKVQPWLLKLGFSPAENEAIGNVHFGFIISAFGVKDTVGLVGAGLAQLAKDLLGFDLSAGDLKHFGDTKEDARNIRKGFALYDHVTDCLNN